MDRDSLRLLQGVSFPHPNNSRIESRCKTYKTKVESVRRLFNQTLPLRFELVV